MEIIFLNNFDKLNIEKLNKLVLVYLLYPTKNNLLYKISENRYLLSKYRKSYAVLQEMKINFVMPVTILLHEHNINMLIKKYLYHRYFLSSDLYKISTFYLIRKGVNVNLLDEFSNSPLDYVIGEYFYYDISYMDMRKIKNTKEIDEELYNLLKQHGAMRGKEILKIQNEIKKVIWWLN